MCFFGDDLMSKASPSGKCSAGVVLAQLDQGLMRQSKSIVRQRARTVSEGE